MNILISILFLLFSSLYSSTNIEINDRVEINRDYIMVSDVIKNYDQFDIEDVPILKQFYRVENRVYPLSKLLNKNLINRFNIDGNENVEIFNRYDNLSTVEIINLIKDKVEDLWNGGDYEIEFKTNIESIEYPLRDDLSISVLFLNFKSIGGHFTPFIEIRSKNNLYKKVAINILIKTFDKVLIPNRNIKRGELLTSSFFNRVDAETTKLKNYIPSSVKIEEYQAKSVVKAGKIIQYHHVKRIPDIRRGDIVNFIFIDGSIKLELEAKCLKDSYLGDRSRFKIKKTGKILRAEVLSKKDVIYKVG